MKTIFCLSCVRNEEKHLQGFFNHLRNYVDGILIVNDGSTDSTAEIIKNENKVIFSHRNENSQGKFENESKNRFILLDQAAKMGADWVLCADPDLRFETRFLKNIQKVISGAEAYGGNIVELYLRELWDSLDYFRVDGIWKNKNRGFLFKMLKGNFFQREERVHQCWYPSEFNPRGYFTKYNVYHLGMITKEQRLARYDKFKSILDETNNNGYGYEYLIDERNLSLQKVSKEIGYIL